MDNFLKIRKILEYEKIKLKSVQKKFFIDSSKSSEENKIYSISQNIYSLPLLIHSIFFPDFHAYFFMELINLFQDLEIGDITYYSYSQAFTTYCLKLLARNHFININCCERTQGEDSTFDLIDYRSIIDANTNWKQDTYKAAMYDVDFQKICSFVEEDLSFLFQTANSFGIDTNLYEPFFKNGKMYLRLKRKILISQIVSGQARNRLKAQKSDLEEIIKEFFYLNENDFSLKHKKK